MVDRMCTAIFGSVTVIAATWSVVGLYLVEKRGDEGPWIDVTSAFALFWVGLVVWAFFQDDRAGYR